MDQHCYILLGTPAVKKDSATYRMVMLAEPMSPEVENLTPSFVTLMYTLSPIVARSLRPQNQYGYRQHRSHLSTAWRICLQNMMTGLRGNSSTPGSSVKEKT